MKNKSDIIEEVLHFYFSEVVASFPNSARRDLYGNSFLKKVQNIMKYFFRSLKESLISEEPPIKALENKNWLYVIGDNNYLSLRFLEKEISPVCYVSPFRYTRQGVAINKLDHKSRLFRLLANLPFSLQVLLRKKEAGRRCWDAIFRASGLYEHSLDILKKYRPKSITFSNDGTMESRALLLASRKLNIPSFYIQHACIRSDFPPLKFSHSFLEGMDSLTKYKESGAIDGEVHLIGVPKLTPYLNRKRKNGPIKSLAVCSNLLDSISSIDELLQTISNSFSNYRLTYRPHPRDDRQINIPKQFGISDSRSENPFDFLLNQDIVIAGNTSIHYEAAMLNIHSVYFKFDKTGIIDDMYGFVKNGLVERADNLDELVNSIKKIASGNISTTKDASYYNALLGTDKEDQSQTLVLETMHKILA